MRQQVSDYISDFLAGVGIKYIFGLTGGAVVRLFDSMEKKKKIIPLYLHHEQAAAFAAVSYSRIRNDLGACCVTTGPGGTNAMTGVLAAWMDSIPCIFISGQSRLQFTSRGKKVRQIGSQEFDIVSTVSHITKYAVMVTDPAKIKYHLEKAVFIARNGRPGPVWIDIPINIQDQYIYPEKIAGYRYENQNKSVFPDDNTDKLVSKCCDLILSSKQPVFLAGYGVRLAHAENEFRELIEMTKIPFVTTWTASDLFSNDHPQNIGRIGQQGQKGANKTIDRCDLLLAVGSHLCLTLAKEGNLSFAKKAKKIIVDNDPDEINYRLIKTDLSICCDGKIFLTKLLSQLKKRRLNTLKEWRKQCTERKTENRIIFSSRISANKERKYIDAYEFMDTLSIVCKKKDNIIIDGGGTVVYISFQGFRVKMGQRLTLSSGICSMGTGIPESIGACYASGMKRTICLIGDGSMQLNIQELQTIIHHKLPVKIFVFSNGGYLSIRHTQKAYFGGRYFGSGKKGGVTFPDNCKIAEAYGIRYLDLDLNKDIKQEIRNFLNQKGPGICDVKISPNQKIISS